MTDTFTNPYSFIPFEQECNKKPFDDYYASSDELLTGKISCRLEAVTQLLIPDICDKKVNLDPALDENDPQKYHREYPFFRVDGRPIIPGSEIRGMLRNEYEVITNSCADTNDDLFYSRENKPKNAGLIKYDKGKYILFQATRYRADADFNFNDYNSSTGDIVNFVDYKDKYGRDCAKKSDNPTKSGYLILSNKMETKGISRPSIFTRGRMLYQISDAAMKSFRKNIDLGIENKNKYASVYLKGLEQLECEKIDYLPVWYSNNGDLAISQISRSVYKKTVHNFLGERNYEKCDDKGLLCPACALFGMIGKNFTLSSRINVSDAVANENNCIENKRVTLHILGQPRLSSLEFYLDGGKLFNYTANTETVYLSGRKFYWHHNRFDIHNAISAEKNNMNSTMEYAKIGSQFSFDVCFSGITKRQLSELYFLLNLSTRTDKTYCHKIGHGKPLGFGSVKISVTDVIIRKYRDGIYTIIRDIPLEYINTRGAEYLMLALDWNRIKGDIHYPNHDTEIFKWFSKNRDVRSGDFHNILPKLTDNSQELPKKSYFSAKPVKNTYDANQYSKKAEKLPPAGNVNQYHDIPLICESCKREFLFTAYEQAKKENFPGAKDKNGNILPPKRCKACRNKSKPIGKPK